MNDQKKKENERDPYELKRIYEEMELDLTASLKRNLTKHKMDEQKAGFSWEMWQSSMLRNIKDYRLENTSIIYRSKKHIQSTINDVLHFFYKKGSRIKSTFEKNPNSMFPEEGKDTGQVGKTPPNETRFFGVNKKKLDLMVEATKNDFDGANQAIYRRMDDVYRQVVYNVAFQMAHGALSLDQAIDKAVEKFLNKGIDSVVYKNGRHVNIATYAEMALRTASQRASFLGGGAKRDELGMHLVFISSHANCCEMCLPWQGKILIDDVFSHPSKEYIAKYEEKHKLLSEAIKAGLLHPNCRHTITTYFDGVTRLPTEQDPEKALENYNNEQHQRKLENKIRKLKRIVAGTVDEESHKEAVSDLRVAQKELRDFLKQHPEFKRHQHREKSYGSVIKDAIPSKNESNEAKKGIDKELMPEIKQATKLMNKEFPMFKELIDKISYSHETTREYAYSETGIENGKIVSSIKLGRRFTNKTALVKDIQRDISNEHTYKDASPASIVTHELTHALEVNLTLKDMGIDPLNVTGEQWNMFRSRYGYISSQIKEQAMSNLGIEFMQPKWYKMYKDTGNYSKINSNEFLAQCISQVLTVDEPSEIALEVYRLLKEMTK